MSTCKRCGYKSNHISCPCTWVREGVPDIFKYACMDDTVLPDFMDMAFPLTLQGPPGIGKSHSAYALAKNITSDTREPIMGVNGTSVPQGLPSEIEQWKSKLKEAHVLIIDEFTEYFYDIINHRMENLMTTILTTNDSIDTVKNGRLYSRIYRGFTPLTGTDYRLTRKPDELYSIRAEEHGKWVVHNEHAILRKMGAKAKKLREARRLGSL